MKFQHLGRNRVVVVIEKSDEIDAKIPAGEKKTIETAKDLKNELAIWQKKISDIKTKKNGHKKEHGNGWRANAAELHPAFHHQPPRAAHITIMPCTHCEREGNEYCHLDSMYPCTLCSNNREVQDGKLVHKSRICVHIPKQREGLLPMSTMSLAAASGSVFRKEAAVDEVVQLQRSTTNA
ncbi:unnamed protein product [Zymoseptoria tritici ST99CH_1A5]|uniref:Uncharacterized protein n=1 Tax=Zymoseptoria tritici ST99CH_1A5 TaxID=1276529 RepID=A0A1Y6M0V6_ZYMTR|nr:unnamed protein product [Zymoseptoria tritici ST99CH_1A5]